MSRLLRLSAAFLLLTFAVPALGQNVVTINIYNDVGNPNLWLYLQYAPDSVIIGNTIPLQQYVQPWKPGGLPLTAPLKFQFSNIDGGKLFFGLMGPQTQGLLAQNAAPPSDSDAFFSFIEFAYLTTDLYVTWDVSNVDQLALLSGMRCQDPAPPPGVTPQFSKCGYASLGQPLLLSGLLQACNLRANPTTNKAYRPCGPNLMYSKLCSPSIVPEPYEGIMRNYLQALASNKVTVKFVSDDLTGIGGPGPVQFTGVFNRPAVVPGIATTQPIVLTLTGDDTTIIYLTATALNGQTIFKSDSQGGMYVYQNNQLIGNNVDLNWLSSSSQFPSQEVSSVIRNLLTAMNLGEIAYTPNAVYDQSNSNTWVPAYTGAYYNSFNKFIVNSSNSYGMPYSDAAHSKVQFYSSPNATIDLHALNPHDPFTCLYYYGSLASNPEFRREVQVLLLGQLLGNLLSSLGGR